MDAPPVRYVKTSDGVSIAYFSAGRGPVIVFASSIWGDANMYAASDPHTRYMTDRLLELGWRVVRYDVRGMGSSQRDVDDFSLEARVLDLQAVVDHLSLQRFAVAGIHTAAAVAMAFAAGNRDRVSHVVVLNGWAFASEMRARTRVSNAIASMSSLAEEDWEFYTLAIAKLVTELDDPVHTQRLAETIRRSSSAKAHQAFSRAGDQIDLRPILPALEMPVLVVHDTGFPFGSFELCQDLAASLPDARLVVIHADGEAEVAAIDTFLRGGSHEPTEPQPARAFRTVMFTDLEGHTAMMQRLGDVKGRDVLREHERLSREALRSHGGTEVKTIGDSFMASFPSAQKAVECAIALQLAFASAECSGERLRIRVGINAGEPIAEEDDLFGSSVILASRTKEKAAGGEIFVTDVVRQLVAGKGFSFADRGEMEMKGFEEPVRLYEVRWGESSTDGERING